ncbi:hypothetical protein JXL19_03795 [bacterium]|nr:hypothetical protein [bacterium]
MLKKGLFCISFLTFMIAFAMSSSQPVFSEETFMPVWAATNYEDRTIFSEQTPMPLSVATKYENKQRGLFSRQIEGIVEHESMPHRRMITPCVDYDNEKMEDKTGDDRGGREFLPARHNENSQGEPSTGKNEDGGKYPKLELGFVIMWDYDQFNGLHTGLKHREYRVGSETELRRACIDINGEIDRRWHAEFEVSFEDGTDKAEVNDAFINFTGWEEITITIGKTKEPFCLEELTSSKHISFIERSMAASAFSPGHSPGLELSGYKGDFTWAIGAFESGKIENRRDTYALTGRLTFTPLNDNRQVLHTGIAGSLRDLGGEEYQIEERAEVHTAEEIVAGVSVPADDVHLMCVELAWVYGPFSLQSEYMNTKIKAVSRSPDVEYSGYYVQGGYFLTGESRQYKRGVFGRVKPVAGYGAVELVSRYSFIDAGSDNRGVEAGNLALGMNYYINKNVRLMVDYIETELKDCISKGKGKAEAISSRIQCDF